ncbi:MAG: hypothetical protein PHQ75_05310 [Thermoguttaceae bacterium]|nr:hypothetical protein [Thermoguttaceae bacterium]
MRRMIIPFFITMFFIVTTIPATLIQAQSPASTKTEPSTKIGTRPYELVWAGRNVDPIKPFLDFEQDEPWTATAGEVDASFARSQEQLIWGNYVYRLGFHAKKGQPIPEEDATGKVQRCLIQIRPPKPKAIPQSPFDVISVWIHGNHWRMGANTQQKIVTPQIEAVFLLPDNKEYIFPLGLIVWRDWFLVYKRLSDEQIELLNQPGVRFNGFNVRGGIQNRELVICIDNLALFQENFKPFVFSARAKRGIDMFPGQDTGFNTGTGKLPFPTRNETILPDSKRPNAKNSVKKVSDKLYELRYDGPDGTLVFEYSPKAGDWSDLTCRWNNLPTFAPLTNGGVCALAGNDKKIEQVLRRELREVRLDGNTIKTTWNYMSKTAQAEVEYHFQLIGKTLLLDTFSSGGKVDEIVFGTVTNVHDVHATAIPYMSCGGWGNSRPAVLLVTPGTNKAAASDSLFVFGSPDWYRSNASILFAKNQATATSGVFHGGVDYRPKTDGLRNDVFERFVVTVSPTFSDVLPTIANPVSPYKHIAGKKLWRVHAANNRDEDKLIWKKVWRYGMREVVINDHETFFRDGGDSFTFRTRSAPGKGGDAATLDYSNYLQEKLGFVYGPYNNFTDFATLNEYWSPDMVSRNSDKTLQPAWMRCYAPKPIRAVEYCERLTPIIKEKFKVNTAYCDVHTAVTPWRRTDYDASVPGAGTFAATFYAFGEIMLLQKKGWNGPVYSEGPNHFMYSGLTDGNYAQDQSYHFMDNPWLVDFDLLKMHDLECNFGMGNLGMFSPAVTPRDKAYYLPNYEGDTPADLDRFIDRFLSATMAFGHTGFLVLDWCFDPPKAFGLAYGPQGVLKFEQGLPIAMRSYYMNQQIASRYTQASVDSIRYCDAGGTQQTTSVALRSDVPARNQLVIRYKDGTRVCVNGNKTETLKTNVDGRSIELPPNGYTAWTASLDILVESKLQDGKRYDYCQSPAYIYLDTRGANLTLPMAKGTGIAVCRTLKDGKYEVIPLPGANIAFAVNVKQATALDFDGKELGPAKLVRDGKYAFVTPIAGATSYILK